MCAPLGMVGMKGGAIANLVDPLGMIGNADAGRSYRQLCVPPTVWLGTPMTGGAIANLLYPLCMIGNAGEGRSCRQFCVPPPI